MDRIQFKAAVEVAATPEAVWDYTQDYAHRTEWDPSILEARVESEAPERVVWIRGAGSLECRLRYKQFERPSRTSLAMVDLRSPLFSGGGGSWSYEPVVGGTLWTQQNSLIFRRPWLGSLLGAALRWWLQRTTERAMRRVKAHLERTA